MSVNYINDSLKVMLKGNAGISFLTNCMIRFKALTTAILKISLKCSSLKLRFFLATLSSFRVYIGTSELTQLTIEY